MTREPLKWQRRRTAVIAAAERLPRLTKLSRSAPLDPHAFSKAAQAGFPFIVDGIVSQWPLATMNLTALREEFAAVPVRVRIGDYATAAFSPRRTLIDMPLAAYLDSVDSDKRALPPYAGNVQVPEIGRLCNWPEYFAVYQQPKLWLGPAGTVTPLHCDYFDNLFAQVWGRKRIRLFPPSDGNLFPTREVNPTLYASPFDPEKPDFETWPLARQGRQIEYVIEPGELLFLPAGWFHHVRAIDFSLSVNRWTEDYPLACQPEHLDLERS